MAHVTDMQPAESPAAGTTIVYVQPMTPGRIMGLTLSVLFVIGVVWFMIQVLHIVLLLILGILIAAAIEPGVNALRRRGISRGPVILAIYLLFFGVVVGSMFVALPPLVDQGQDLVTRAPELLADLQQRVESSPSELVRNYGSRVMDSAIGFYDQLREDPPIQAVQVAQAAQFVTSFFGLLFAAVSILIVTFYWMTEKAVIKRFVLSLVPIERRDHAHDIWDEIESKAGGWARGQVILMLAIGIVSTIVYSPLIFNLPFWFLLGIWAGLMEMIPFVGPWIGGGLAVLVALTNSWQTAVIVAIFVFVLNQVEASVLVPRVMRDAVGLSPLSVILAILVGGSILGPLGAILAIPVAAVVQVLISGILRAREEDAHAAETAADRAASAIAGIPLASTVEPGP